MNPTVTNQLKLTIVEGISDSVSIQANPGNRRTVPAKTSENQKRARNSSNQNRLLTIREIEDFLAKLMEMVSGSYSTRSHLLTNRNLSRNYLCNTLLLSFIRPFGYYFPH